MTPPPIVIDDLLAQAGWVRRLARRLAGDAERADELTQRTLLVALQRQPERGKGLRPWLSRVLTRMVAHDRRGEVRRKQREHAAARPEAVDASAPQLLEEIEEQQKLARMVTDLPEPYRTVILRRYYRGEEVAAIAKATQRSAATARSQLSRGLALLREDLDRRASSEGLSSMAVLALAGAFSPAGLAAHSTQVVTMKTTTQIATAAGLLLAVFLGVQGWQALSPNAPDSDGVASAGPTKLVEPEETEEGAAEAAPDGGERTELAAEGEAAEDAADAPATQETSLALRVVDDHGFAVVGARMQLVGRDGAATSSPPSAPTDEEGRTTIPIATRNLRVWRGEIVSLRFALEARRYETQFLTVVPRRNERLDLGTVVMPGGGSAVGVVVDEAGEPVEGARIVFTKVVLEKPAGELQLAGPGNDTLRVNTTTAAGGHFEISGLPIGEGRIWAHAQGCLWSIGDPIDVQAGGAIRDLEIVLHPIPAESRIAGRVEDPLGAPVPGAEVSYRLGMWSGGTLRADASGEFVLAVPTAGPVLLRATDPKFGPSEPVTRLPGEEVLVLRLPELRRLPVRVSEVGGGPIEGVALMSRVESANHLGEEWEDTDADGRGSVIVPESPFMLTAGTEEHHYQQLGPFEPSSLPAELVIELEPKPRLHGVVTVDGKPWPGASVEICQVFPLGTVPMLKGFPQRILAEGLGPVITDEAGRFRFGLEGDEEQVVILAWDDGFCVAEQLVTLAGETTPEVKLKLELTPGGALEGTLSVPPGEARDGRVIAISRGDGHAKSTRTDADGRYDFEHLSPGGWRIEIRETEASVTSLGVADVGTELRTDFVIVEGKVTVHDLDAAVTADVTLEGQLSINGKPAAGWSARLILPGHLSRSKPMPSAVLDAGGGFLLATPPGRYELELRSPESAAELFIVHRVIDVEGPTFPWSADIRTGTLHGTVPDGPAHLRVFNGDYQEGNWQTVTLHSAADGTFEMPRVPVGYASVQREEKGTYGFGWYPIGHAEVGPGERKPVIMSD